MSALIAGQMSLDAAAQDARRINFVDPQSALLERPASGFGLSLRQTEPLRFGDSTRGRNVEVAVVAGIPDTFEISLSRRARIASAEDEDARGGATEVRVGRGLLREQAAVQSGSRAYAFIASDDDAMTWRPYARSAFGGRGDALALQNRVEVGDLTAGVTYERNGVQASLAYVEREESTRVGRESFSLDQSFTGVTITMRR
jgi:hypothetical protein